MESQHQGLWVPPSLLDHFATKSHRPLGERNGRCCFFCTENMSCFCWNKVDMEDMDQWSTWIWVIIVSCRRRFLYTFFIWYTHMKIMKEQCYCWWLRNPAITTWDVSIPVNIGILYQPQPMQDFFKGAIFARLFCDSSSSYSNSLMWEVCMEKNSGSSLIWDMAGKPFRNPDRTALCCVVFFWGTTERREKRWKEEFPFWSILCVSVISAEIQSLLPDEAAA